MNLFVEQLVQLVPPPRRPSVSPIWADVERSVGFELPGDYKELAALYGPGKCDDFLVILHPQHPVSRLNLSQAVTEATEVLREFEACGEVLPVPVDQLLAIALTDNGDTVYWVREPSGSPDRWRNLPRTLPGLIGRPSSRS